MNSQELEIGFIIPNLQQTYYPGAYVLKRRHISYDARQFFCRTVFSGLHFSDF